MSATVHTGDCLEVMPTLGAESVDSIVTDPPYGLSFMGKDWDRGVPGEAFWSAALRVAKPGSHMLAFGGTRTFHRLACAIEDAGWEIRDCLSWLYGSGFPKSLDVSKALDKAAGAEREVVGQKHVTNAAQGCGLGHGNLIGGVVKAGFIDITAPSTPAAKRWSGWGTALKPAWEPIIMARKPLVGTVAENVTAHGTGGINVDGCRIGTEQRFNHPAGNDGLSPASVAPVNISGYVGSEVIGRWPANLFLDEEAGRMLDEQAGHASRFFYCPKASKRDRGEANHHPTVKPTDLMRYLCRLVTQPGGVVLDPFVGSGSTGKAARLEGFAFVGIDREAEYLEIARRRIAAVELPLLVEVPL